ncbi:MAG: Uma2 family endonuclease [Caulobacter sp.]|nr:Uma2 family endonuclease [Caulobacter sp.]
MKSKVVHSGGLPRHVFSTQDTARLVAAGLGPGVAEEAAKFTLDDVFEMMRVGALDPDAKVELIDGELVEMSPQNSPHMYARHAIAKRMIREFGDDVYVHVEGTLRLAPRTAPSPDIFLHAASVRAEDVRGPDVLLLVEIADSSLTRDLRAKARLYARFGVPDYWVVDAVGRRIFVHRAPTPEGYAEVVEVSTGGEIAPLAFPDFVFSADEIPVSA